MQATPAPTIPVNDNERDAFHVKRRRRNKLQRQETWFGNERVHVAHQCLPAAYGSHWLHDGAVCGHASSSPACWQTTARSAPCQGRRSDLRTKSAVGSSAECREPRRAKMCATAPFDGQQGPSGHPTRGRREHPLAMGSTVFLLPTPSRQASTGRSGAETGTGRSGVETGTGGSGVETGTGKSRVPNGQTGYRACDRFFRTP